MLNEQLTCAVPLNCIEHAGIAGLTKEHKEHKEKGMKKKLGGLGDLGGEIKNRKWPFGKNGFVKREIRLNMPFFAAYGMNVNFLQTF
ncbi:MAG: hypothetical protein GX946_10770 [Oligosphaeraceae bacterium]|nr:hypothetical protein [Oligosphaeraceae bacterium]